MIDDKALLSEYLSESEELLDSLLTDLDTLAARPADLPDINLINRIFRTVHSLKGLSGMMGLPEVQSLTHEFEDILDDLRLGHLSLTDETKPALQEAGAGIAALVGGAARGTAGEEDFERMRALLTGIAARPKGKAKRDESGLEALSLSTKERRLLTEYEEHRINENLDAGRSFYAVVVQFEVGKLDTQYRALTAKLESKGELITTLPESAARPELVAFKLVLATQFKESDLKGIVESFEGRLTRLGPSTWRRAGAALINVGRGKKKAGDKTGKAAGGVLPPAFAQESLQPLSPSVRVEMAQIDELSGLAHELSIEMQRLAVMADRFLVAAGLGAREQFDLRYSARRIEREFLELEERLVELRMVSLAQTFTRAARLAGRLARELGKSVAVELAGRETQLDKVIVDRLADAIYHLLRNAIDHGIEMPDERRLAGKNARGRIKIEASLEGARAVIAITDDGHGIDSEAVRARALEAGLIASDEQLSEEETLQMLLRAGFSTVDHVSAVSGRGVGLDAVERTVHELGGELRITSEKGHWTRFELAVPTTLVLISAFIVRASEWRYAINVGQIVELLYVSLDEVIGREGRRSIQWRNLSLPLVELKYLLGLGGARVFRPPLRARAAGYGNVADARQQASRSIARVPVFVTRAADRHVAVAVEEFEGQREIIVKSLGPLARKIKGVVGAVDLEGGDVALVLDLPSMLMLRSMRM
jgi:two-component system, chemotaxis family, sensor kinase CheA